MQKRMAKRGIAQTNAANEAKIKELEAKFSSSAAKLDEQYAKFDEFLKKSEEELGQNCDKDRKRGDRKRGFKRI